MIKRALLVLFVLLVAAPLAFVGLSDSPMKTLEEVAIRHADKLPLAYAGEILFDANCASCHDNPEMHAPTRQALSGMSKESVLIAMEFGKMQPMAAHLNRQTRGLIAIYLAGMADEGEDWVDQHMCDAPALAAGPDYALDWGLGTHNRRFIEGEQAGISRANVDSLELAWTLAFPRVTDMRSQPAVVGDTLYFGDKTGRLYAIDRRRGCVVAHNKVFSGIRSAITVARLPDGRQQLVFADSVATVFAADPVTLEILWQRAASLHEKSVITGSITAHEDKLFVPVSSYEVAVSGSPGYTCCESHGGVIALSASTGETLWQWHATPEAQLQGYNADGGERWGPSGASVWTTPAVDARRNRIYFGTGENLTRPATDTSDAIIALDMDSGELIWRFQATKDDVWNAACLTGGANCPDDPGGDFDFGASVIIATHPELGDVLLAGQKSGEVFALDPDTASEDGEVLWRNRISLGTTNGGIHWGMALSGDRLLVPVADPERDRAGYEPRPGLSSLDVLTGEELWYHPASRDCEFDPANNPLIGLAAVRAGTSVTLEEQYRCSFYYGYSAAVTATEELVFSAALDGTVRAFDIASGEVLWRGETAVPVTAGNGVSGHGGAIDVGGQVLADGWLYVQSGYSMFGQLPGNVLFAFKTAGAE